MSEWLKHNNDGAEAAKHGNYDEAREHFLKADRVKLKNNPHFRGHEMGFSHQASDHELAMRHSEKPTDALAKLEHHFALNKLPKTRHPNKLLSVTNKRTKKAFSDFASPEDTKKQLERTRSHNRHLRSKLARNTKCSRIQKHSC